MSNVIGRLVKRQKQPDKRFERQIIIGLITSTEFLQNIIPIFNEKCIKIPFARVIAKWAIEYYEKYSMAPGKQIENIFNDKEVSIQDSDEVQMIKDFLSDISNEYIDAPDEPFDNVHLNIKPLLDRAELYFRQESLSNLIAEVKEAEALVKGYIRVTLPQTVGIDPILDTKVITDSLNDNIGEKLFSLPGDLGKAIGVSERGWLVAFAGIPAIGKTWWLMDVGLKALFKGYKVLFISLEMSEHQMVRRIQHYMTGLPEEEFAGNIKIPYFDRSNAYGDEMPLIKYKMVNRRKLTTNAAVKKSQIIKRSALLRGGQFKLLTFPANSISVDDLEVYLYNLEQYDNFVPDVIITDYADKFRPNDTRLPYRLQVAQTWATHKAIAQEKNCLMVTASQSNAARTGKKTGQGSWAETISKLELSDVGMAINMAPDDKNIGAMEVCIVKHRHKHFDLNRNIKILHQLQIGRIHLDSCFMPRVSDKSEN